MKKSRVLILIIISIFILLTISYSKKILRIFETNISIPSKFILLSTSFIENKTKLEFYDEDGFSNESILVNIGSVTNPFINSNKIYLPNQFGTVMDIYDFKNHTTEKITIQKHPIDIKVDDKNLYLLHNTRVNYGHLSYNDSIIGLKGVLTAIEATDSEIFIRANIYDDNLKLDKNVLYIIDKSNLTIKDIIKLDDVNQTLEMKLIDNKLFIGSSYNPDDEKYNILIYDTIKGNWEKISIPSSPELGNTIRIQKHENNIYFFQRGCSIIKVSLNNFQDYEIIETENYIVDGIKHKDSIIMLTKDFKTNNYFLVMKNEIKNTVRNLKIKLEDNIKPYKFIRTENLGG